MINGGIHRCRRCLWSSLVDWGKLLTRGNVIQNFIKTIHCNYSKYILSILYNVGVGEEAVLRLHKSECILANLPLRTNNHDMLTLVG